jgi:hypothetical protein
VESGEKHILVIGEEECLEAVLILGVRSVGCRNHKEPSLIPHVSTNPTRNKTGAQTQTNILNNFEKYFVTKI